MDQVRLRKGGFTSRRKVSRHNTSLVLTVPKLWVRLSELKEGDEVLVQIVDSRNLLVTIPEIIDGEVRPRLVSGEEEQEGEREDATRVDVCAVANPATE
jgi:intein/homing endonuclease